jgi:hypothetical protein
LRAGGTAATEIVDERFADIRGQRKLVDPRSFSSNSGLACYPVDVLELEVRHLVRS